MTLLVESAGRWLEPGGNSGPRGMIVTSSAMVATEPGLQADFTTFMAFMTLRQQRSDDPGMMSSAAAHVAESEQCNDGNSSHQCDAMSRQVHRHDAPVGSDFMRSDTGFGAYHHSHGDLFV